MARPQRSGIDPVDFEIIANRLGAVVDEMALSLRRSAYSAAACEMMDFSTAICDRHGHTVVQGVGLAIQLGLIPGSLPELAKELAGTWRPGDVVLLNHPYRCGAHLNDLMAVSPIFVEDEHVGFAATILHHLDVGGRVPGSIAADNRQIFEDGLIIPPVKVVRGGEWDEAVVAIFRANVRTPDQNMGDLRAQIAALRAGEREVRDVCEEWGIDVVRSFFSEVLEYSERLSRQEIERLPDGEYSFDDWIDDDGVTDAPVRIRATVRVRGDQLSVDFSGSEDDRECGINSPLNSTRSITYAAVRSAMSAAIPENSGLYRTIDIDAPVGSIVHAAHPAAVGSRGLTLYRVADALHGALAELAPDRVSAAGDGGALMLVLAAADRSEKPFVFLDLVSGGWGGRPQADGIESAPHIGVNHSNTPVEIIETEFPIRIERYGFVPDTEGPGQFRGSLSTAREYTVLTDMTCVVRSDRRRFRPWGLNGGHEGSPSSISIRRDGDELPVPAKSVLQLRTGDTLCYRSPSGGGWGAPSAREADALRDDIIDGKVTAVRARAVYGVEA